MKFDDYSFSREVKQSLETLNFKRPTDIQYKAIPPIMRGEDVLGIAQTGTGKTAAFAIPIIDRIHKSKTSNRSEGIKCIVMEPTRELAVQIAEVFNQIGKHTRVKSFCVFGGVEQDKQITALEAGIDILIATPGRMFDLVSQGYIKLDKIDTLVLDEADHMLDLGFNKDIVDLLKFLPKKRQTLFLSATINKKVKDLSYSVVSNPIRITISPKDPVSKNVTHKVAFVEMDDKRFFLERLINENEDKKILVFVRTKVRAERVYSAMDRVGIKCATLHGDKEQKDRLDVLNKFKSGEVKVLIATDVSARGIDIPNVEYVVVYDLPEQPENYVHRVGRTGRGKNKGLAVSFCSTEEKGLLKDIEAYTGNEIKVLEVENSEYQTTIDVSLDSSSDWKTLMKDYDKTLDEVKKKAAKKINKKRNKNKK